MTLKQQVAFAIPSLRSLRIPPFQLCKVVFFCWAWRFQQVLHRAPTAVVRLLRLYLVAVFLFCACIYLVPVRQYLACSRNKKKDTSGCLFLFIAPYCFATHVAPPSGGRNDMTVLRTATIDIISCRHKKAFNNPLWNSAIPSLRSLRIPPFQLCKVVFFCWAWRFQQVLHRAPTAVVRLLRLYLVAVFLFCACIYLVPVRQYLACSRNKKKDTSGCLFLFIAPYCFATHVAPPSGGRNDMTVLRTATIDIISCRHKKAFNNPLWNSAIPSLRFLRIPPSPPNKS